MTIIIKVVFSIKVGFTIEVRNLRSLIAISLS